MSEPRAGPVSWSDEVDDVLGGDLTAALAYSTPGGGAVVTAVAPVGLRDRAVGTVSFTTSLAFGRKLERIRRDPRVALAYHAREHGFSASPRFVLVQGTASVDVEPDPDLLAGPLRRQSERFLGPPKQGVFWDWWLREYYRERVVVDVAVARVVTWPDLTCSAAPEVVGVALPDVAPPAQDPPRRGTEARVDVTRVLRRLGRVPHRLLSYVQADGFPTVVPVEVAPGAGGSAMRITASGGLIPPGGRRAGVLGHGYRAQLVGLTARVCTGWLEAVAPGEARYAPHTYKGFRAPPDKTLLLVVNGLVAKHGMRAARRKANVGGSSP